MLAPVVARVVETANRVVSRLFKHISEFASQGDMRVSQNVVMRPSHLAPRSIPRLELSSLKLLLVAAFVLTCLACSGGNDSDARTDELF